MCAQALLGFDRPLELIRHTHQRLEHRCALMQRLSAHLSASGCDADAQATAGHIVRFFEEEMAHHHEDEELEFYDAVVEAAPAKSRAAVAKLVAELRGEHERLQAVWRDVLRPQLAAIMEGRSKELNREAVDRCHMLYVSHIEREEETLLPIAEKRFSPEQLERLGRGMAERRKEPYPDGA
ncbi:MAG: hemerythrin domain-containing protein [Betaproteobacteria bacterium]|jgi:pyridoxamine 5'-phosphate oxidase|nr:hemerythrin domain-containing protein [Betaproteobacteria bacterium]